MIPEKDRLDNRLREILEKYYGNKVGGEGLTHWYINDQVLVEINKLRLTDDIDKGTKK